MLINCVRKKRNRETIQERNNDYMDWQEMTPIRDIPSSIKYQKSRQLRVVTLKTVQSGFPHKNVR